VTEAQKPECAPLARPVQLGPLGPRDARDRRVAFAAYVLGTLAFAAFIVKDFSGPLVGGLDYDGSYRGDANYFEFLGYFVRDHWHFGAAPISFATTDVAYPFGTHIGLLSWCAERDLFHALMLRLAGPGPWLQVYVTLGVAIGAFGTYLVLERDFGPRRAGFAGFAGSLMAFYAWYKFPYHINIAAIHWVVVSIAADAVTMRRAVDGERLTPRFLVMRAALIGLSVGLDLGYVAGHALTSVVVTLYCVWSELGKRDPRLLRRMLLVLPTRADWTQDRAGVAGWALVTALPALVYVPFVAAVARDTATYPMVEATGNFWASQLHALFPYLPFVHPNSSLVHAIFGSDEGIGEYAPGFTLILGAGLGVALCHREKRGAAIKPMLITALLVFTFHPRWCKTLMIFPWFAYHRVAGRGTTVLPILLGLMAVAPRTAPTRGWLRAILGFGVAEVLTAVFLVSEYRPTQLSKDARGYFTEVSKTSGKGLLEWPFCIASAHAYITDKLCPYFDRMSTAYAYRRFHEKSTVSIYLSRVSPSQFAWWLENGWPTMFKPDDPERWHPERETACFDEAEWAKFDALYTGHDFAGVQLYRDLLPDACVDEFHRRYGAPSLTTVLPRVGRTEFLPRR
jgi:hypothetical protein